MYTTSINFVQFIRYINLSFSKIFIFVLIVTYSWLPVLANNQQVSIKTISRDQGLSENTVLSITQDSKGFMWIGTLNGLNRYDGTNFVVYQNNPNNPNSISGNIVSAIYEDQNKALWIGTNKGLNLFDPVTNSFTLIKFNLFENNKIATDIDNVNNICAITQGKKGILWIGTLNGLIKFDPISKQLTRYLLEKEFLEEKNVAEKNVLPKNRVNGVVEDANGILWINSPYKLYKFDQKEEKFTIYPLTIPTLGLSEFPASSKQVFLGSVVLDLSGIVYLPTINGVYAIDTKTYQISSHYTVKEGLSSNLVSRLFCGKDNILWVGLLNDGVDQLNLTTKKVFHYQKEPKNHNSLTSNNIVALYQDRSGVLWVGNGAYGANKLSLTTHKFQLYQHNPYDENSLSDNYVRGIYQDKENIIWIATQYKGLNRFDPKTQRFKHYTHNPKDPNSILSDNVWSLYEDQAGDFWVGTINGGIQKFDRKNEIFQKTDSKQLTTIYAIYETKDKYLWFGDNIVLSLSPDRQTLKEYPELSAEKNNYFNIQVIYEDQLGNLWIGTDKNLLRYDRQTSLVKNYSSIAQDPKTISPFSITSLLEDHNKNLWISTKGGGICKFNREQDNFTRITKTEGLPHNSIYAIFEDKSNNFWLSSDEGIIKYNTTDKSFRVFGVLDGVQNREFNRNSYFQTADGTILFGGIKGFNIFVPNDLKDNLVPPPVVITGLKLFDKYITLPTKDNDYSITLDYTQNFVTIEYAALDFHLPEANHYKYKLENVDSNWVDNQTKREAIYTNLSHGEYNFQVVASNSDGVWNNVGAQLKIIITPPLWRQGWAYVAYILIGLSLLQYYRYILKQRNLVLEEKVQTRTSELAKTIEQLHISEQTAIKANQAKSAFLAIMSHEIRTPMNGVIGMANLLMNTHLTAQQREFVETLTVSGEILLNVINDILDFSKIESGKLELEKVVVNLKDCIEDVIKLLTPQAKEKGLKIRLNFNRDTVNTINIDVIRLRQILVNLIGNAIKFTHQGEINILVNSTKQTDNIYQISFQIKDTGIGIATEQIGKLFQPFTQTDISTTRKYGGTGLGLAISQRLCELMGGNIKVESELNKGSTFYFTILAELSRESVLNKKKLNSIEKFTSNLPLRILVADDNLINQKVALSVLGALGYKADIANNGLEVLAKLEQNQYDVILMDVQMPEMDGLRATREIHKLYQQVPKIIAMTAGAMEADKEQCLAAGMDDYISKPIKINQLQEVLLSCKIIKQPQRPVSKEPL